MNIFKKWFYLVIPVVVLISGCSKKTKPEVKQQQVVQQQVKSSDEQLWTDVSLDSVPIVGRQNAIPIQFRTLKLNAQMMHSLLAKTVSKDNNSAFELIPLPNPNGGNTNFKVTETLSIDKGLLAKYPYLRTYGGKGATNSTSTVKVDFMPNGFHAYIISTEGTIIINPVSEGNSTYYFCYFKHNSGEVKQKFEQDSTSSGNGK